MQLSYLVKNFKSPAVVTHSPSVLGTQEYPLSTPESQGYLQTSQKPKELSTSAKGTLPVPSSLSSIQRNLEPSAGSTGILDHYKNTPSTSGPLPQVREDVESSQSASATLVTMPPSPPEPGRCSSFTPGGTETFPSGQGRLVPLQSAHGPLKLSISAQAVVNTSQCFECSHNPLCISSSEKGTKTFSDSAHGAVCPCLSIQGTVCLFTSMQSSTQHCTSAQRLSTLSIHTQL